MKRIIMLAGILLACFCTYAQEKYEYSFDRRNFDVTLSSEGKVQVECTDLDFFNDSDAQSAPFPYKTLNVYRECGISDEPVYEYEYETIFTNIEEECVCDSSLRMLKKAIYGGWSFEPITFAGNHNVQGKGFSSFVISPFKYDKETKTLYFVKSARIIFPETASSNAISRNASDRMLLRSTHSTNSSLDLLIIITPGLATESFLLTDVFKKLGLRTECLYTNNIYNTYTGSTNALKIKSCIKDYYDDYGIKSVLLVGDTDDIPSISCHVRDNLLNKVGEVVAKIGSTRSDLFYAALSNTSFDWNSNGNGRFCEVDDNVDLTQHVAIARLPVHASSGNAEYRHYVSKLEDYIWHRKSTGNYGFYNNILFAGATSDLDATTNPGDAKWRGDKMYDDYVAPYANVNRYSLFDTYANTINGSTQYITSTEYKAQLSLPYSIVHHDSHGSYNSLTLLNRETLLGFSNLTNTMPFIILSSSCSFNEHVVNQTCLGEQLIGCENGAVASHGGYYNVLGGSNFSVQGVYKHNAMILRSMYSNTDDTQIPTLGSCIQDVRNQIAPSAGSYNKNRWNLLAMNTYGVPDMPVYTEEPSTFTNVSVVNNNGNISVNTGVANCEIILMSEDNGFSRYEKVYGDTHVFNNVTTECRVIVKKRNYIPYVSNILYNIAFDHDSPTFVCDTVVYSITGLPGDCVVEWSTPGNNFRGAPYPTVLINHPSQNLCTVANPYKYCMEFTLCATVVRYTNGQREVLGEVSKTIITEPRKLFSTYSQEHCNYYGVSHPAISTTNLNNGDVKFVHQGCNVFINCTYLKGRHVTYSGVTPDNFFCGNNIIGFSLPLYSGGTPFYIDIQGDGSCINERYTFFSITNNQNATNNMPRIEVMDGGIVVELLQEDAKFSIEAAEMLQKKSIQKNDWSVEVYSTPRGEKVYSADCLDDTKSTISTAGWKTGTYIVCVTNGEDSYAEKVYVKQ